MLVIIDNYDSFTYNVAQYLYELGQTVKIFRNDKVSLQELQDLSPERIIISPGPGRPENAGISLSVIDHFAEQVPILGICLGHQGIGHFFGANVRTASEVLHGKLSAIEHNNIGVFRNIPNSFDATRYHSLVLEESSLPSCLEVSAWVNRGEHQPREIMGVSHKTLNIEGVQFHPESISSEYGYELFQNFLLLEGAKRTDLIPLNFSRMQEAHDAPSVQRNANLAVI